MKVMESEKIVDLRFKWQEIQARKLELATAAGQVALAEPQTAELPKSV